jgi:hypothetical protein
MQESISQQIETLPTLGKGELQNLWKKVFNADAPESLRKSAMIPILGYRIQELAYGGLSAKSTKRLLELARAIEADPTAAIAPDPRIKPGTRLVRQWHGQVHVVNVEETGYEYKGSRYGSLSEVAQLITGTKWSGPRFFGLNKNHKES